MKKTICLLLVLAMCCALVLPAGAADAADARLHAVTETVKTKLALDTAAYEAFNGNLEEGMALPIWDLSWAGDRGELNISATETGKILRYHCYDAQTFDARAPFSPRFPKRTRAEAQKNAQAFLNRALEKGLETAVFEEAEAVGYLSADSHSFYGRVLENGLPSPFTFRITIRVSDGAVTNYALQDSPAHYLGAVPSAKPSADAVKAAADLKSTLTLRLEYVLDADEKNAVLRYLPISGDQFYVDGQSGALVNLSALYTKLDQNNAADEMETSAESPASVDKGMTEAEQAGISKLEGVLSREALDTAARKYGVLGLGKYTLFSADFQVDDTADDVTALLSYAYKSAAGVYNRNVRLDARSGALLGVSSHRPWREDEKSTVSAEQAKTKAEAFLKELIPAQFGKTARYDASATEPLAFLYAQSENSHFFPESYLAVDIDPTDGSIAYYGNNFLSDVSFQSATGIVTAAAALDAWFASYAATLGYQAVPVKLDLSVPDYRPLIENGYSYLLSQKLGWSLTRSNPYLGVDAKTGKALQVPDAEAPKLSYSDLNGHWVKAQAEQLAAYQIGWCGGKLRPTATLTQRDMVALLVSTNGTLYDPADGASATDSLYNQAYRLGILTKAARNDTAMLTRGQTVKLLLDAMGYGGAANLKGIYKCSFTDERSIPAAFYGYAALAQGLGIARGDQTGRFQSGKPATRAEAVSMLYLLMKR